MSTGRPPPGTIPTLTEVVSWPATASVKAPAEPESTPELQPAAEQASAPVADPQPTTTATAPAADIDEDALTRRILADVERQVDLMLEVRLREALAPVLTRATDTLVRDARKELTTAMRDVVARAVARELARRE